MSNESIEDLVRSAFDYLTDKDLSIVACLVAQIRATQENTAALTRIAEALERLGPNERTGTDDE